MVKRPSYAELYQKSFAAQGLEKRSSILKQQLKKAMTSSKHQKIAKHVRTLLTTQTIGAPLFELVKPLLVHVDRIIQIRQKIAARTIQHVYLEHLYRPRAPGEDWSKSFVCRSLLLSLNGSKILI